MKEDDEIQSYPSPGSGSPDSPMSNGRITVTVAAAAPPPPPSSQGTITLALPNQQSKGGGGGGGGGREDCWSEGATSVLIDAWGERYLELSRGNLKQKHWKEVADIVSSREDYTKIPRTDIQCKNRIDTVKKKYKTEKAKIIAGGAPSKWPFFDRLDQLIGPASKNPVSSAGLATAVNPPLQQNQKVPLGIPVVNRSVNPYHNHQQQQQQQQQKGSKAQKIQLHKRPRTDSDSSASERETSPTSSDSFLPENFRRKNVRVQKEVVNPNVGQVGKVVKGRNGSREKGWGNAVNELTQAILKFGEAYEQAESSKLQQVVEMEKQRMKFAKDLELQRMQFFMKTQLEISQLKHGRRVVAAVNHHHCSNNNNNNSNSDSSN
ncbi:trihelix transcription factor ASIL1-like [Momordica charantia]|uniref:Trihelix transcription factor ASIL1-like n=1 Tax=Momordica charantia TaxID=3673 RepID=A0A6J1DFX4_MOMCH|nr:trihelix transcription factor ASIL1-like [Momordica charantia]